MKYCYALSVFAANAVLFLGLLIFKGFIPFEYVIIGIGGAAFLYCIREIIKDIKYRKNWDLKNITKEGDF